MCKELVFRFPLEPDVVSTMRCATRDGHSAGRSVRYLPMFDPALLSKGFSGIPRYDDLATHKQALLFGGPVEKGGDLR